tara:strand:+ start:837 stop:1484 length:648 start_codon:yes stop_codon:yes gene_type:complete
MKNELKKRILSSIFLIPIVFFIIIKGSYFFYLLLLISFIIASYEWHILSKHKSFYNLGFLFLLFSFYSMFQIRIENNSYNQLLIVLLICIFTDIGGYVFGKVFKGPKLISFSPNKTISGMIGSYILSVCLIPVLIFFNMIDNTNITLFFIYVILISTVSQFGDIIISYFKRRSNFKDTGKIIPGHGGLLDRIDGMIFAFPFAYLIMLNNLFDKIK